MASRVPNYRVAENIGPTTHGLGNLAIIALISLALWAIIIAAAIELF